MAREDLSAEFELSDREIAWSWLAEYYRRPGARAFRVAGGPLLALVGASMVRGAHGEQEHVVGWLGIAVGVYHALKPLLACWLFVSQRRRAGARKYTVMLGATGIRIGDGKTTTDVPWADVTASGRGQGYLWYEVKKSRRATIPLRAMADVGAFEARLRERGHFQD